MRFLIAVLAALVLSACSAEQPQREEREGPIVIPALF